MDLVQKIGAHVTFWDLSRLSASENLVQRCNASSWLVSIIPSGKSGGGSLSHFYLATTISTKSGSQGFE